MVTFLGIAGKINDFDINEVLVKRSNILFLEDIFGMKVSLKKLLIKQSSFQISQQCLYQIYSVWKDIKLIFKLGKK